MKALLPYVPAAALVVGLVGGYLRYRQFVKITSRQTLDHGPFVSFGGSPSASGDPFDAIEFTVTNRSLRDPVFVRSVGVVGRGTADEEVRVEGHLRTVPQRLERNQGQPWEHSFGGLAERGMDLRKGVRGWAIIDGRENPYRSRLVKLQAGGNRAMPMPTPRRRR
ncbi:MAG: hypothetical protein ABI401_13365 [Candidatus Dormibacter sp.]